MPVTARLSKGFYDRFGDEIANELVEWFNSVDATYRSDLKDPNERNFVRFEAGLDRRAAEIDLAIERRFTLVDARFAEVDRRFGEVDRRFAKLEANIDLRFATLDTKLEQRFASVESLLREHTSSFDVRMAQFEGRMMRWMLTFWVGTLGGLAALVWAMVRAR
jgi:hypothetical protein